MQTLIVYDETGYVLLERRGEPAPKEPKGVPFMWVEIPEGKRLKLTDGVGIDVTVTPHQPILEDLPKTEVDVLKQQVNELQDALVEIADMLAGGVTNG